jgi:hypothetical protein
MTHPEMGRVAPQVLDVVMHDEPAVRLLIAPPENMRRAQPQADKETLVEAVAIRSEPVFLAVLTSGAWTTGLAPAVHRRRMCRC